MAATTTYDDIYSIAAPEGFVTIRGKRIRIFKMGPRKFAMLARRFPEAGFLQNMEATSNEDGSFEIKDLDVLVAMAAAAVGKINDEVAEDHLENAFGFEELGEIIAASMQLTAGGAGEDFTSRSA